MVKNLVPPDQSVQPPRRGHKSSTASRHRRKIAREHAFRHRPLVPPAQSNEPPREGPQGGTASRYWPPAVPSLSLGECLNLSRPPPWRWSEQILSSSSSPSEMTNPSQESLTSSSLWTRPDCRNDSYSY